MTDAAYAPEKRERELLGRLRLALPQLHGLLRAEGFAVGPDRWQNAYDLLLELQARGALPQDAAALRPLLAPLFCRNDREQAAFERIFEQWLSGQGPGSTTSKTRGRAPPAPELEPPPKPRLRPVILGLVIAALALALVAYAGIWLMPEDEPVQVLPVRTKPPPDTGSGLGDQQAERALETRALPPRGPLERPQLNAGNRTLVRFLGLLVALSPAAALFAILSARWMFWTMVLRRRSSRRSVPLTAITLDVEQDDLFDAPALREALKRLHTPVVLPTRRLDAAATVKATAGNAGLFKPVRRDRRMVPDCVVLIDHRHGADQMAGVGLQAVARMRQAGLEVLRYDYQRDPRRLMGADGRWHGLAEVAARHEGARLLVIGEATALVNPLSGSLYVWADALDLWPRRGLLSTRRPSAGWTAALAERGFLVADLSSGGLERAAVWFSPVRLDEPPTAGRDAPVLPPLLQDAGAWLHGEPPPPEDLAMLDHALLAFLGRDGLLLLAAMGRYPQLHWGLTRALDMKLFRERSASLRERRLLAVARLPWCRAGYMPDWLRDGLRAALMGDELDRISRVYLWLMNEAVVNGRGNIRLPVSFPEREGFRRGLRRWLRAERQVSDRFDPLNDRVFAETLFGPGARSLDFLLPRTLARHLGPRLRALVPRLALGALVAAGVGWTTFQAWDLWGKEPVQERLLAAQLRDHEAVTVEIWHTPATADYAGAIAETLAASKFQVVPERRELALPEPPEPPDNAGAADVTWAQPVNAIQWGYAADEDAAMYLVRRLTYLTWGVVPNKVAPGAEPPATGPGLDTPPLPRHLRVLLLTPARERTGFVFSDGLDREPEAAAPEVIRDCADCPEMVALPGGSFQMGSPEGEPGRQSDEGPPREVRIAPFAIGRTEVTFDQYDRFADATGRGRPGDQDWGRGDRPVINVSWEDALAYADWLSKQTGQRYRLPSEAEWEYAARAGTDTPWSFGSNADDLEKHAWYSANSQNSTHPVGTKEPNPWGLYDMHGNVWEWVQDCWNDSYEGAPVDGTAREGGDCALRVVRGGGWNIGPENLRSALRDRDFPGGALLDLGFRLARDR